MRFSAPVLLILISACATHQKSKTTQEVDTSSNWKDDRKVSSIDLQLDEKALKFETPRLGNINYGLLIKNVLQHTAASAAGLKPGDYVIEYSGKKVEADTTSKNLHEEIENAPLGTEFKLTVLSGVKIRNVLVKTEPRSFGSGEKYSRAPKFWNLPYDSFLSKKIYSQKEYKFDRFEPGSRFAMLSARGDQLRPAAVRYLLANPLEIHEATDELAKRLRKCGETCDPLSDLNIKAEKISSKKQSLKQHLDFIESTLLKTQKIVDGAFVNLEKNEKEFLVNNAENLVMRFMDHLYLHEDDFSGRRKDFYRLAELLEKVDVSKFSLAMAFFQSKLNKEYFLKMKRDLEKLSNKEIVATRTTPLGLIVIAGVGDNDHSNLAHENTALIVDLGGNDLYSENVGSIVDLSGNDVYESSKAWTLGSAKMKASFLMDFEGNDTYVCENACLGASLLGAAYFADFAGIDSYKSANLSQASSFAGVSTFIDFVGDDTYQAQLLSQGVGIAGGQAVLADLSGDDSYKSITEQPSSYGDVGQFESWSQGVGVGLRYYVSGGVGILYDRSGADKFEAGTFSQGGGYYYGWGALISDGAENDSYKGMRYSQGFAAHSGVGSFLEMGGNDTYSSPSVVGEGVAWDMALALFEDRAGDDTYKTCTFCLGAAAQSSFAFFLDFAGKDKYEGGDLPAADPLPGEYHGGKSFGFFLDEGGQPDYYDKLNNGECVTRKGEQLICDH
jgi:hypothetical protein